METTTYAAIGLFGDFAVKILGPAPVGYEVLQYAFSGVIAIFFIKSVFALIFQITKVRGVK